MNRHFTYNFVAKTIVGSKRSIDRANKGLSPEYEELTQMLAEQPTFNVAQKVINKKAEKKTYSKLTLTRMEEYIKTQADADNKIIEFKAVQKVAEAKGAKYPLTKKWFLATYPEYKENEISTEQTEALIAAGAIAKAEEMLEDIELTEEELSENEAVEPELVNVA